MADCVDHFLELELQMSCNGRFSGSRAGIVVAVDGEVTLAQHDRCHHQG